MRIFLKYKWIIVFVIICTIGIILFTSKGSVLGSANSKKLEYGKAERKNVKQTLTLSGKVKADQNIDLKFQSSGRLNWVGVKEGDSVKKGQIIASLDKRDLQKNLQKQLNSYMTTRWDFEQMQDDNNVKGRKLEDVLLTDKLKRIIEKSQFDLNSAVINVELESLALEYANLVSPINGIITHIDTPYSGINITPAGAVFSILNPESTYLSVSADQNEVISLHTPMEAKIVLDSYPDASLSGVIEYIALTPKTDETNTVYEIKVNLPHDQNSIIYRIDMTADAIFTIKEKLQILTIPTQYIKQDNDTKFVYLMKNNSKIKTIITIGDEFDTDTEILSGLSEGDLVYD